MQPPLPCPTPTWHNDTYSDISPSRPELSVAGKTVVITGAGSGVGRETARAFAEAGAARLILLGRTEATLKETASSIPGNVSTETFAADVNHEDALQRVAAAVGTWDILIFGAGFVAAPATIAASDINEWWRNFETNIKGTFLSVKAFLPTANKSHAIILAISSGSAAVPATVVPGHSAYMASKLAQVKVIEYLAAEEPNIFAAAVHPGMVDTYIFRRSGATPESLPMDTVKLPAHFLVWLTSPEASFLKGRMVSANWDVKELKEKAEVIKSGSLFTSGIYGFPYSPATLGY